MEPRLLYGNRLAAVNEALENCFTEGCPQQGLLEAMRYWAHLTEQARACLLGNTPEKLPDLMNRNFDKRAEIYRINEGNLRMIHLARELGLSAKFTGSGGATVGVCPSAEQFAKLQERMAEFQVRVIRPNIVRTHA